jgi:hypothetical protein
MIDVYLHTFGGKIDKNALYCSVDRVYVYCGYLYLFYFVHENANRLVVFFSLLCKIRKNHRLHRHQWLQIVIGLKLLLMAKLKQSRYLKH